jgi:hypothetical protein
MRHEDVERGRCYLFTDMHGHGLGRLASGSCGDGPVVIVDPMPQDHNGAFAARCADGQVIEVYSDELSCMEHPAGSIVSFGDHLEPGRELIAVSDFFDFITAGHHYKFTRWNNSFTLNVEGVEVALFPERFVYA